MTLIYRSDKGSPLTSAEGDGNIHDLDDRLTFVEENPPEAVSIDEITQDVPGGPLTILMTDSTTQGPFTLPSGMPNFRGDWLPSTLYAINDWITASGALYAVIFAHTSDLTFDPGANDGGGHDYYQALLELPDSLLPDDGVAGQVIKTADGTSNTLYFDDETLSPPPVVEITATSFAPSALTDGNKYYRCTHASGCLVTLPLDADVAFAIGTELHFRQSSAVPVVFDQGSDTPTINVTDGFDPQTDRDGAVVTVKKIDTDEWDLFGLLSAGSGMIPGVVASQLLGISTEQGDSIFIAVGSDDTQNAAVVMTSDNGVLWHSQTISSAGPLFGVATNGTRWVAVGVENDFSTPIVVTSDDGGISWTPRTAAPTSDAVFYSVAWSGTAFIAVGNNATDGNPRIMTSPDGAAWTARTADPTTVVKLRSVSAISGLAVACGWGSTGTPRIMSSANDGASWTARTSAPTTQRQLNGVVCQSSRSVIVGLPTSGTTTPIQSSSDGTTWATETGDPSTGVDLFAVTHNGTLFVAVGTDHAAQIDPKIMTSPDGDTWTARTPDPSSGGAGGINLLGVDSSGGMVVAVGRDQGFSASFIMSSADGMTWNERNPDPSGGTLLFAVAGV